MEEVQLTSDARERIRKDIVNHKIELEVVGAGGDISREKIDDLEQTLKNTEDRKLASWWEHVGEWVASRGYHPQEQFNKLVEGEPVDYGYVEYKYEQPY